MVGLGPVHLHALHAFARQRVASAEVLWIAPSPKSALPGLEAACVAGDIPLAQVSQPHNAWFINKDPDNFIQIKNGSSAAAFLRLYPNGLPAICPLEITGTYYAIADTASAYLEYFIISL